MSNERAPPPWAALLEESRVLVRTTSVGSSGSSLFLSFPSRRDGPRATNESSGDDDGDDNDDDDDDDEQQVVDEVNSQRCSVSFDRLVDGNVGSGLNFAAAAETGDTEEEEVVEERHLPPPPPSLWQQAM
jgi:hypothetical protein